MTNIQKIIDETYQQDASRILATLIRLLNGNFDLAEEALHDAFTAALTQWPQDGVPANARAWLISTGRFKAIDRLRKRTRFDASLTELTIEHDIQSEEFISDDEQTIEDDHLRLIFTCCHPGLSLEARIALTLREICSLTTEEIAAAFLLPVTTVAQRIVRAKNKIRDANIPYVIPEAFELADRLQPVLQVIYLVFNEGYSASSGELIIKKNLSAEAIRLARLLQTLLPEAEVSGLLALMLLHDARELSRTTSEGDLIPLEEQNRNLWKREQINEGCLLVTQALQTEQVGPYSIQAAIAAIHAEAEDASTTDWTEICGLYTVLLHLNPTPIVELNRAVAIAMRDGPLEGLRLIDAIFERGDLHQYHLAHAAKADLYRRLDQTDNARAAYLQALHLVQQGPEKRFIQQRLSDLPT